MRCEDLTRELARPTGALASAEVLGHLAACPACAERSRRDGQLDRIWEATRPLGPSMDAMDDLWARAARELDGLKSPATLKLAAPGRARRPRRAMVALFVAQAAAILVAALIVLARNGHEVKAAFLNLPVEFDTMAVVRIDEKGKPPEVKMQDLSSLFASPSLPDFTPHDEVGEMEVMASSFDVVASSQ